MAGAIGFVPLNLWRLPTHIAVELVVERLVFVPGRDTLRTAIIDEPTGFEILSLEKFSKVTFRPARLEAMQGAANARSPQRLSVEPSTDVVIRGDDGAMASVSVAAPNGARVRAGRLESFSVRTPAIITIGATHGTPASFTISVAGQLQALSILPSMPFELTTRHSTLTGTFPKLSQDMTRVRATLSDASPFLEIQSGLTGLTLTLTPFGPGPVRFLGKGGTAIDKIELVAQGSRGDLESTLAGTGAISFVDFPAKKSITLTEHDALSLGDLAGMSITALEFSPNGGLLHVKLEGTAGKIISKSGTTSTDHRSTRLDELRHSGVLQAAYVLFTLLFIVVVNALHVQELLHKFLHVFRSPT